MFAELKIDPANPNFAVEGGILYNRDKTQIEYVLENIVISSLAFEDRDGLHLLVIRCMTNRGKELERTSLAAAKYSDEVVTKFLYDAGLSHLWKISAQAGSLRNAAE